MRRIRRKLNKGIKPNRSTTSSMDLSMRPNPTIETSYQRRTAADVLNITIYEDIDATPADASIFHTNEGALDAELDFSLS